MAEEQGTTESTATEQPAQQQEQTISAAEGFANQATAVLEFLSPETVNKLQEEHKKLSTTTVDKKVEDVPDDKKEVPAEGSPEEIKAAEEKLALDTKAAEEKAAEEKAAGESKDNKNVFGINKGKEKKTTDIVIENTDQILDVLKNKFGQDYKAISELPKFFETAQKWRASAQELEKTKEENSEFRGLLEGLPPEFIDGIKAHYNGQDYMTAFANKPKFDFSKPVEKQDKEALVNTYFPGKFTEEDFKEESPSPALEIAIQASVDKFNNEKTNLDNKTRKYHEDAQKRVESVKQSVESSVQLLSQAFPDVNADALNEIKGILDGGPEKMMAVFLNKDGTMKQEAAKRFLLAIHGESQIEHMMGLASNVAETKVNEEILSRGADTPGLHKKSGGQAQSEVSKEVQKQIDELKQLKSNKTF